MLRKEFLPGELWCYLWFGEIDLDCYWPLKLDFNWVWSLNLINLNLLIKKNVCIYTKRNHNQGKGIYFGPADLGAQNRTKRTNCETNWPGKTDNYSTKSEPILVERYRIDGHNRIDGNGKIDGRGKQIGRVWMRKVMVIVSVETLSEWGWEKWSVGWFGRKI